jgi:hypothetical protein
MPLGPMRTKAQKQAGMHEVMGEFKRGQLHSGSKAGPTVTNRKQAIAIGLSQTGQSRGYAGGGIVEHDFDPDLPRRQEDAQLVPLTQQYPPAYLETIQRLLANQRRVPTAGEPRKLQAGGTTQAAKHTQEQVNYRRGYPMRQCSVCSMYTHKANEGASGGCTAVSGPITPYGLCDLWHCLPNPYGHKLTAEHRRVMEDAYDHAHGYSTSKFSHNRR